MTIRFVLGAIVAAAFATPQSAPLPNVAPDAAFAADRAALLTRLAPHPYFQRVELVACSDFAPTLWLVQRPANAKPGFERDFAAQCEPWVAAARKLLRDEFGAVLPDARRSGRALDALVVLASEGDFGNYWKLCGNADSSGVNHWNGDLALGVLKRDVFETPNDALDRANVLYLVMRSLLDAARVGDPAAAPCDLWVREGLAFAVGGHDGDAKAPHVGVLPQSTLRWYLQQLLDPEQRRTAFLPIDELLRIGDWSGLLQSQSRRTGATIAADNAAGVAARYAFIGESALFVHWLLHEETSKGKALLLERLASHLGTGPSLKAAPVVIDAAQLQAGFVQFLAREAKRSLPPELQLPPEVVTSLAQEAGDGTGTNGAAAVTASANGGFTSKLLDPAFDPALLLEEPLPPEGALGMALLQAAAGDLDGAAAAIATLIAALPADDELAKRAQRDRARLKELSDARREFFTAASAEKRKLRFDHEGAAQSGTLQEIDGDVLLLVGAKGVVVRVPLATVSCEELLREMSECKRETGSAVARAYAALLAGRKSYAKAAAGTTPDELALRADGAATPPLLTTGAAARLVESLARAPRPATVAHGEATLETLRALLHDHRREPLLLARLPTLRTLAAFASAPLYEARGLPGLPLAAKVEHLGEGRVRITWDFEKPEQAGDFEPAPVRGDLRGNHELKIPAKDSYARIDGGALRLRGASYWRSKLAFAAPLTCRYRFAYIEPTPFIEESVCSLSLLLCDDGGKRLLKTFDMAGIEVRDTGKFEQKNEPTVTDWDVAYDVTVLHDGKRATLSCKGFPDRFVPVHTRQSGLLGVMSFSDVEVRLDELVLEASLDPALLGKLRETWLEQELAALFDGKPAKPKR